MSGRWWLWLFPRAWRERYGVELADLLHARPPNGRDVFDLLRSAVWLRFQAAPVQVRTAGGLSMSLVRRPLAWISLLLVLPSVVFLLAAAARLMQPATHQPAHGATLLVGWVFTWPHWATGLMFWLLPLVSLAGGLLCARTEVRSHLELRSDLHSLAGIARRHGALLTATVAVLLSLLIIVFFAAHAIAG